MDVSAISGWLGELEHLEKTLRGAGRARLADQAAKLIADARSARPTEGPPESPPVRSPEAAFAPPPPDAPRASDPFGLPPWQPAPREASREPGGSVQPGPVVGELSGEVLDPHFLNDLYHLLARGEATGILHVTTEDLRGFVRFHGGTAVDGLLVALTDVGEAALRAIPLLGGTKAIERVRTLGAGTFAFTSAPTGFK